jgi:hypothetical protein
VLLGHEPNKAFLVSDSCGATERNCNTISSALVFLSLFHSEYKVILYLTTMHAYCFYPAISKSPKHLQNVMDLSTLLLYWVNVNFS